jgi:hypothetical protein
MHCSSACDVHFIELPDVVAFRDRPSRNSPNFNPNIRAVTNTISTSTNDSVPFVVHSDIVDGKRLGFRSSGLLQVYSGLILVG